MNKVKCKNCKWTGDEDELMPDMDWDDEVFVPLPHTNCPNCESSFIKYIKKQP